MQHQQNTHTHARTLLFQSDIHRRGSNTRIICSSLSLMKIPWIRYARCDESRWSNNRMLLHSQIYKVQEIVREYVLYIQIFVLHYTDCINTFLCWWPNRRRYTWVTVLALVVRFVWLIDIAIVCRSELEASLWFMKWIWRIRNERTLVFGGTTNVSRVQNIYSTIYIKRDKSLVICMYTWNIIIFAMKCEDFWLEFFLKLKSCTSKQIIRTLLLNVVTYKCVNIKDSYF